MMDDQRTGRPVVVGVDGSASAAAAVRWAAREAARRGAPLRLVAATGWPTTAPQYTYPLADPGPRQDLPRRARAHLAAAVVAAREAAPDLEPRADVLDGYPVRAW